MIRRLIAARSGPPGYPPPVELLTHGFGTAFLLEFLNRLSAHSQQLGASLVVEPTSRAPVARKGPEHAPPFPEDRRCRRCRRAAAGGVHRRPAPWTESHRRRHLRHRARSSTRTKTESSDADGTTTDSDSTLRELLQPLVDSGAMTEEEADALVTELAGAFPYRPSRTSRAGPDIMVRPGFPDAPTVGWTRRGRPGGSTGCHSSVLTSSPTPSASMPRRGGKELRRRNDHRRDRRGQRSRPAGRDRDALVPSTPSRSPRFEGDQQASDEPALR